MTRQDETTTACSRLASSTGNEPTPLPTFAQVFLTESQHAHNTQKERKKERKKNNQQQLTIKEREKKKKKKTTTTNCKDINNNKTKRMRRTKKEAENGELQRKEGGREKEIT